MKNEEVRLKNGLSECVVSACALLVATIREIFDENAYARFISTHHLQSSRASYAAFLRENGYRRERRARCC